MIEGVKVRNKNIVYQTPSLVCLMVVKVVSRRIICHFFISNNAFSDINTPQNKQIK